MVNREVLDYKIRFYGRSQSAGDDDRRAELILGGRDNETKGSLIAKIFFWDPSVVDTRQDRQDEGGWLEGNMSVSQISAVIDMLRYEKPIYILWDVLTSRVLLQTGQEPVGEEENS